MLNCMQNEALEMIATLSQADTREFEKLDPKVLEKLAAWLGDLDSLLNWLLDNEWAEDKTERAIAIEEFVDAGTFGE